LAHRHDVALIEDDVSGELYFGGPRPAPLKAWARDGDVTYCASFTTTLAPSFRLCSLSPGRHPSALEKPRPTLSRASPALLLGVLSELLASGDYARISRKLRARLAEQMERVADAVLASFPRGTRLRRPQGGLLLWVEGPEALDSG
ncbi:PLP-dependent aminotransferase family protein, partial [Pseudomonas sp. MWU12-2323]|nr:PLP-dependent aminotransferase family protein [Pseudomonas sp. MWU12-2323]